MFFLVLRLLLSQYLYFCFLVAATQDLLFYKVIYF